MRTCFFTISILLLSISCQPGLQQDILDNPYIHLLTTTTEAGASIDCFLVEPECYDPSRPYPALLVLPAGNQDGELALWTMDQYFLHASMQRNWIMICPVAPDGQSFYTGGENLIPGMLDAIGQSYNIEGGKYHVAGVSAGGISAFRIAVHYPERVRSILALPGYSLESDSDQLYRLEGIPVVMFAGEWDYDDFLEGMQTTFDLLTGLGFEVSYTVLAGESHVIQSLSGEDLFDILDTYRP